MDPAILATIVGLACLLLASLSKDLLRAIRWLLRTVFRMAIAVAIIACVWMLVAGPK